MRKPTFKNLPIKYKLILVIMFTSLLGLLLSAAALVAYDWHASRNAMIAEQQVLAQVIGQRSSAALAFRDKRGAQENLDALSQQKALVLACLYDAKGVAFLASKPDGVCPDLPEKNQQAFSDGFLHIYHQIVLNDKLMGSLYLRTSVDALNQKIQQFGLMTLITISLVALLAFLLTARMQRVISAPIQLLGEISKKVSTDKDYSHRAAYNSEDELGVLVNSFNHMMQTIEDAQTELKNLAFKDALTGLPNRRLLMTHLQAALQQMPRNNVAVGLFLIDLDGFKAVNDTLGHEAGDWVLIQVSERLQRCLRSGDVAARLGGDEFTVMIVGFDSVSGLRTVAEKVCQTIDEPIYFQGQLAKVSASIGISMAPTDAQEAHELMKLADGAMYDAKRAGKNGFVFANTALQQQGCEGLAAEDHLLSAIKHNQLQLFIDPQYELGSKNLIGGELLVYEKTAEQNLIPAQSLILGCERKAVVAEVNLFLAEAILNSLALAASDALEKIQSFSLRISFQQINHPEFMQRFTPVAAALAEKNIRFILIIAEQDLKHLHNMQVDWRAILSQHHLLFAVEITGLGASFIGRWPDFPLAQLRFKSMPRESRVADKQKISQTTEYLHQVLVELCQYLLCDSVVTNLIEPEQIELFTRINCDYAQGLAFSEALPLHSFIDQMTQVMPLGFASGQ